MTITPSDENAIVRLLRAGPSEVRAFALGLPETRRAHLALFCHARAHFRDLGLLIARECSARTLKSVGGHAGDFLSDLVSRSASAGDAATPRPLRRISLAGTGATAAPVA